MDIFKKCANINDLLQVNDESEARNQLIRLLDHHDKKQIPYTPLVNHLIREVGLYPYLDPESSNWQDRFAYESFKVDIGQASPVTLHREQSLVLKHLLEGTNLAVSAPTSFGKSLIIDAFIAIQKPTNILILVPTIALTDETRRRLYKKFSDQYKIVTTADVEFGKKNIFIFPQERAIHYCNKLEKLDLLVIDEFYKASQEFDQERSPALLKAMIKLGKIASQKYYLAPNVKTLSDNPFTKDMLFLSLDFNTVFLEKYELYKEINQDTPKKKNALLEILDTKKTKSLIYAGTYTEVNKVSNLLLEKMEEQKSELLFDFSNWLKKNYDPNWILANLVKRATGIHTGQLHRSLSQIQVKLFEEKNGLNNIVSTSSIIEGVNTSAENVILWSNRNGTPLLDSFTYRNIIGRSGRMFRYFVGNIYILEPPPPQIDTQLELTLPDQLLADIDETEFRQELTKEQIAKILLYKEEMTGIFGVDVFDKIQREGLLTSSDTELILKIANEIRNPNNKWRGLSYLNAKEIPEETWNWLIPKILKFLPGAWDCRHKEFTDFIKILMSNWQLSIPDLLNTANIDINKFFKAERNATFKLTALLSDINVIQKAVIPEHGIDISPFIARLSNAFLPSCVFQLEEYGLPRMLTKKIHNLKIIDFENEELSLHDALNCLFQKKSEIYSKIVDLDAFDKYVLDYFFDGISGQSKD